MVEAVTVDLLLGDCVKWANEYEGEKFHALLTDAPYELAFMNKHWDATGISTNPETWRAFANVLHDGAFCVTFAGSRTYHRIACAIEDAGFIIHPIILAWCFGSGFPKATRIDTQVDKAAGAEREVVGTYDRRSVHDGYERKSASDSTGAVGSDLGINGKHIITATAPATPLAATWAGHRYGLQALKPALEPIIVFQKPYRGKPVDCITRTGAGALNIDAARIAGNVPSVPQPKFNSPTGQIYGFKAGEGRNGEMSHANGRWASNFILTCSPSCNGTHAPDCPAAMLDEQSGESLSSGGGGMKRAGSNGIYGNFNLRACPPNVGKGDTGGASRFFFRAQWDALEAADPVRYVAKASRRERDAGLDAFELKPNQKWNEGGIKAHREETAQPQRNPHPTVKPIALSRYLATLLLPPAEYAPRRLFVPFAGVASEMIGAMQAGWDEIVGVEQEQEYVDIGKARIEYWQGVELPQLEMELTS